MKKQSMRCIVLAFLMFRIILMILAFLVFLMILVFLMALVFHDSGVCDYDCCFACSLCFL